jgi:shikimate kinase
MKTNESTSLIPNRTIALVGMMGAGKSVIGRHLAARLGLPFVDSDAEIETAAGMTIAQFFDRYGESEFRQGERRVIARLLGGGLCVLATGGGAFMDTDTRTLIRAKAISVWLKADVNVLLERALRRDDRPLLRNEPRARMEELMAQRERTYAEADITVESDQRPVDDTIERVVTALKDYSRKAIHA